MSLATMAALFAAAGLLLFAFRKWRTGVKLALVMIVVEGAIRKWVFPETQQILYFAKDGILLAAFAGYLRTSRGGKLPGPRLLWMLIGAAFVVTLLHTFNPALPSLKLGLIGLKSYVFYCVLLILVPAVWTSLEPLIQFLRRYLLLAIPTAMLAAIQFAQPVDSIWNRYSHEESVGIATFAQINAVRVTSSFPFVSGYSSYLLTMALVALALLAMRRWSVEGNVGLWLAALATLVAMPMTGSRWPVYSFAGGSLLFIGLMALRSYFTPRIVFRLAAGVLAAALLLGYFLAAPTRAFLDRAMLSRDQGGRMVGSYYQAMDAANLIGVMGYGAGATHNAAVAIVHDMVPYSWLESAAWRYEDESARVIVELGVIGFLVIFALRLYLIALAFRQFLVSRHIEAQCLSAAAAVYFLTHLSAQVIFNPTSGMYFWFIAGILIVVHRSELEARAHQTVSVLEQQSLGRASGPAALAPGGAGSL